MASGPGRINLAEELRGPWDHAVITTFSIDLAFFERAILPMLSGTRGRLILTDGNHLLGFQAAAARDRLVRSLNRGYLAGAIATPAAAHAKVILLLAPDRGRLLVGSGNLGLRGWASVGELFTRYEYSEDDEGNLSAFSAARDMLDRLAAGHYLDDFSAVYLQDIWTQVPWLGGDAEHSGGPLRHSVSTPLLDQLLTEVTSAGHPVQDLVLLAPFHDTRCAALEALLRELQPTSARLLVQPGQTSIDPMALGRVLKRYPNLSVHPFEVKGRGATEYVHAKMILATTTDAAFCFQGSANLSRVALMRALPEGNLEANNLLIGAPDQFDTVLKELKIGKAVKDPRNLELGLRAEPSPDPGGVPGLRLLEARWEGALLWMRVAGNRPAHASQEALVVVGTAPIVCRVLEWNEDASRPGQSIGRLEVPADAVPLFDRAVSIWLYSGDQLPKHEVDETELSNPVFCINQPALTARLHGSTTANRVRELGWLSIAEDRELEDLIRALQGTMVFDQRTLIDARAPDQAIADEPDDSELLVAYSSIDYEALRSNPRLNQYMAAMTGSASKGLPVGPSDIQLALRSITDAFNEIVGRARVGTRSVELNAEWARVAEGSEGSDDGFEDASRGEIVPSASEEELEADPTLEEESSRRWSEDARLRTHWRNFIRRFLRGMASKAWCDLVGPAVIGGNYLIFSHIMQRLHKQPWRDFGFLDFLLGAQARAHGFVWSGGTANEAWIDQLGETELGYILEAFRNQHLAVRLVVDLAAAGSLTRAEEFDLWEELIEERKAFRDSGRAALSHPAWRRVADAEASFMQDATAIAADLAGAGELACWTEPPSSAQLIADMGELLDFSSDKEVVHAVGRELNMPPSRLELHAVTLGDARLGTVAEEIRGPADGGAVGEDAAVRAMAVWSRMSSSQTLRLAIGRSRLLLERDGGRMIWMSSLSADEVVLPIPERAAMPWDGALADLAERISPVSQVGS
jgi:hypothetical protein